MSFPLFWGHCKGYRWVLKIKFNSRWRFPKLSSDVPICCGLNATSYQNLSESILLLLPLPRCYLSWESIRMHQTGHDFWSPKKDLQSSNSSLHVTGGGPPRSLRLLAGGGFELLGLTYLYSNFISWRWGAEWFFLAIPKKISPSL